MPRLGKGGGLQSRQAMVHSLVHTESWAIDLSWDIIARFGRQESMPREFFTDFVRVALDEGSISRCFQLIWRRWDFFMAHYLLMMAYGTLPWKLLRICLLGLQLSTVYMRPGGLDVLPTTIEQFRRGGDEITASS